jgi:hypothetical protein
MTSILDHDWGRSQAEDKVWGEILGIASSDRPWERRFVVLRAYIDDSYKQGGPFVLGGYVAHVDAWASFTKEWEALLPTAYRGPSGKFRFKMSEMAGRRMDRVGAFYSVIERHVTASLHCKIDAVDLARAKNRIWSDNVQLHWGVPSEIFPLTFSRLIKNFHNHRYNNPIMREIFSLDHKVDFFFDKQTGSDLILDQWDSFVESSPREVKKMYGDKPRFEDDDEFLPIQAADFWAWWARHGYENGLLKEYNAGRFGLFRGTRTFPNIAFEPTEDQLVEILIQRIKEGLMVGGLYNVYDANVNPKNGHQIPPIQMKSRSQMLSIMSKILRRSFR